MQYSFSFFITTFYTLNEPFSWLWLQKLSLLRLKTVTSWRVSSLKRFGSPNSRADGSLTYLLIIHRLFERSVIDKKSFLALVQIPSPRPFHLKKPLFCITIFCSKTPSTCRGENETEVKAARSRFKTTLSVAYFFSSLISFFELSGHFDKVSKRYVDNLTVLQSPIALARWQRLRENPSFALSGKIENGKKTFDDFAFFSQIFGPISRKMCHLYVFRDLL